MLRIHYVFIKIKLLILPFSKGSVPQLLVQGNQMFYCCILACLIEVFVGGSSSLSSAEASLYRTEGWREGKRNRAGNNGKGKKPSSSLPRKSGAILNALYGRGFHLFPLPIVPRALSIFRLLLFLLGYPAGASAEERGSSSNAQFK